MNHQRSSGLERHNQTGLQEDQDENLIEQNAVFDSGQLNCGTPIDGDPHPELAAVAAPHRESGTDRSRFVWLPALVITSSSHRETDGSTSLTCHAKT